MGIKQKAVIVGAEGQDGKLLFDLLDTKNYEIVGFDRESVRSNSGFGNAKLNILNSKHVSDFIISFKPDEIYYLAAAHHSAQEMVLDNVDNFSVSLDVNVEGLVNFLEGMRKYASSARLFYAASSHIFKGSGIEVQNENTPISPLCIYGITKAAGIFACRYYRSNYSLFATVGIMYNHESPLRSENFLSRKVISGAVRIRMGLQRELIVGDLDATIDWGYAPDYVDAMRLTLALDMPDEFIIASGELHTVRDFVSKAFDCLDLDYRDYVKEDPSLVPKLRFRLVGDSSKIRHMAGWAPKTDFARMIHVMIEDELMMHRGGHHE